MGCDVGVLSSRTSLLRLLLGAAFVLLGFFLASSTSARADDLGLVKSIDSIVEATTETPTSQDSPSVTIVKAVEQPVKVVAEVTQPVVADTTKQVQAVKSVVRPVVKPVVESVAKPVVDSVSKPVVESVAKPVVKSVTEPVVESVVKPVTKIVAATTAAVITKTTAVVVRAVEPLAPVSVVAKPIEDIVAKPIEDIATKPVKSIVPEADSAPDAVLPDSAADVSNVAGHITPADSVKVLVSANAPVEQARAERAPVADRDLSSGAGTTRRAASDSPFVSAEATQAVASMRGSGSMPNHPGAPVPAPVAPAGATLSGAGSTGNSTSVGAGDVATTSLVPALPESLSDAMLSRASRPHPGPSLNPGSRPD